MRPPHGAFALWLLSAAAASAGLYAGGVSPGNVPWPGGVVPYVFDPVMSAAHRSVYLDGLREYELAANVHFIPRSSETQYVLFKYDPAGPNRASGSQPQIVEINLLTRGQICHEMGHSFGLEHEHQRADRNSYLDVLDANIAPGNEGSFAILPTATSFGSYDFESVMHYGPDILSVQPGVLPTMQVKPAYAKYQKRMGNFALSPTDRAMMSFLYGPPVVAPTGVVTTTADGGPGSLRAALYHAADHPGTPVTFNIPITDPGYAAGTFTIKPTGYLPPFATNGITVDGSTQPGYTGSPLVFLDGSSLLTEAGSVPGLLFYQANCRVKALGFRSFPWSGMALLYPDATGNTITGCWSGLDASGNAPAPNAFQGIHISDGASGNTIGGASAADRNVLSGNTQYGIWISGAGTTGNSILGNYIGTNAAGSAALANHVGGLIVTGQSHHNTIGNPTAGNLISGNESAGLWLTGEGVDHNGVSSNLIGLNAAGTGAVPNTFAGMYVLAGASDNTISGNVFSGNVSEGLRLADAGTTGNLVQGNRAGTNAAGTAAVANGFAGITVFGSATANRIDGNLISGNGTTGLAFGDVGTSANVATGNYIGTNATGNAALPNGFAGVYLTGGCSGNLLGDGPGTGNLISGNGSVGVLVADTATHDNSIRNNRIGPDASGGLTLTNQFDGIQISAGAQSTVIGGTTPGAANRIAGNSGRGIALFNAATAGNSFRRNSISGNAWDGIGVYEGSNHGLGAPGLSTAALTTSLNVSGSFSGPAGKSFRIEFFSTPSPSPSAGRDFIGEALVTTDGSGSATISTALTAIVPAGRSITATATSETTGDSSAFSNPVTVTTMDGDQDEMPDAYENSIPGLNAANAGDAAGDLDGDGTTNLNEFLAGTNPRDAASRLAASGLRADGNFVISFPTVSGVTYRAERSANLPGSWTSLAIHIAGTGGVIEVPAPLAPSQGHEFFRVSAGE